MTDYERGRLAGFAEGVEAAAGEGKRWALIHGHREWESDALAAYIRALLAPSPAAGRTAPGVEGEPASGYGLHPAIVVAPSPATGGADYPCVLCGAMASVHPAPGCTGGVCGTPLAPRAPSPKEDAPRCPGCGAELSAADYAMAVRKHAFRPGLTNNPGGWAAPITWECQACGRSPSTGGDR